MRLPFGALCFDCTKVADGVYEAGCKSFVVCANGVATLKECEQSKVYDAPSGACADEGSVGPPCGTMKDCSKSADGKFADTDQQCKSYYTCSGGTFFGHNYCAKGLVFNEALQTCDWPADTDPPCGTKGSQRPTNAPGIG
ncbi:chitin-binding domain protein cbd-1-like [Littorina saxatilis]|uniref:chitin-binding domain protein cbd-1-like n=1 Tax=Littorina saxatilis TaxID=31220 RepID=UPI0038B54690